MVAGGWSIPEAGHAGPAPVIRSHIGVGAAPPIATGWASVDAAGVAAVRSGSGAANGPSGGWASVEAVPVPIAAGRDSSGSFRSGGSGSAAGGWAAMDVRGPSQDMQPSGGWAGIEAAHVEGLAYPVEAFGQRPAVDGSVHPVESFGHRSAPAGGVGMEEYLYARAEQAAAPRVIVSNGASAQQRNATVVRHAQDRPLSPLDMVADAVGAMTGHADKIVTVAPVPAQQKNPSFAHGSVYDTPLSPVTLVSDAVSAIATVPTQRSSVQDKPLSPSKMVSDAVNAVASVLPNMPRPVQATGVHAVSYGAPPPSGHVVAYSVPPPSGHVVSFGAQPSSGRASFADAVDEVFFPGWPKSQPQSAVAWQPERVTQPSAAWQPEPVIMEDKPLTPISDAVNVIKSIFPSSQATPSSARDPGQGVAGYPATVASYGPAPPPAPLPPTSTGFEQRPHIVELDLEELELLPDAPDLETAWYETEKYSVSFHPTSESLHHIGIPREAPRTSVKGQCLVSKIVPAVEPGVKVKTDAVGVAQFKEQLTLLIDHLDVHLLAYAWGRKTSNITGTEEVHLIGRQTIPLRDFSLQRKPQSWSFFDVNTSDKVAEMRMKLTVCTTPGAIQKPNVSEREKTEVTVRWSAPANDHGSPVIGYRVAVLLPGGGEPTWHELCKCTSTANPVYVVTNLAGNTSYMLDIRAVNKVGEGDPCEFEVRTAPVEPDPPSKPYIAEARDGCLCIAWHPPKNDGGTQISAYKVKMRKILGAHKWNPFGKLDANATWVEMGTVGSFMEGKDPAALHTAWVGPLEEATCEYRFQIIAMSRVGNSQGSELSDAHYV
eukprot:gnl/TRDRNA2_/TRDRNA2_36114_c0_seq1.p1 gnl/TRDRNA2_/TRDRNA2_36114_c0~~gnl/TRDRNA2_/TRDRNA2_36114_c0_seq1.p1  ORF type:complete len:907 (-),score=113.90 gnl/TRDRNA2_/TRDRNA2_36114_c0_seq1:95-2572(-)